MKVIVTGATGFVGSQVLKVCIRDSRITSILVLSRRDIPSEYKLSEKVKVLIQDDFSRYSDELVSQLSGAEASIWCIGGKVQDFPSIEVAKTVQVDYTLAAAEIFASKLAPDLKSKPFRFVFCSGAFAARDQEQSLWFAKETRRIKVARIAESDMRANILKGQVENGLIEISNAHPGFETYIMRPGGILPENSNGLMMTLGAIFPSVKVDRLASTMVEVAVNGHDEQTFENDAILKMTTAVRR